MKISRFIATIALAALVFTACGKDDTRIRLFAEGMNNHYDAKIWVDPDHNRTSSASSWVAGESIDLNGSRCGITQDGENAYYLDIDNSDLPEGTLYSVYPATVNDGSNDIAVTNLGSTDCAVAIHKLAVNFVERNGNMGQNVYFPMAAMATSGSQKLLFKHLTGGLRLTLSNTSGAPVTVDTIKVGATNCAGPAIWKNLRPNPSDWDGWNPGALPAMPGGEMGESNDDHSALFVGEMTLVMQTNGQTHVTIPNGESIIFCIPLLADSIRTITIKGYNGNSTLFYKEKNLVEALHHTLAVERNTMYTIPTIEF